MQVVRKNAKGVVAAVEIKAQESFLSRWNRRKSESRSEETAPLPKGQTEETLETNVETTPPQSEPRSVADQSRETQLQRQGTESEAITLTDEDMPNIETLNEDSDFSQFLSQGVSDELRNKALRKLFHLPEFNFRDGLNDYDEDFTQIPKLSSALAGKVRQWVEEQKEDFNNELSDNRPSISDETTEIDSQELSPAREPTGSNQPHSANDTTTDEDIGDADLEG